MALKLRYRVRQIGERAWVGEIRFPGDMAQHRVACVGADPATAALRAATLAQAILDNPDLQAFFPLEAKIAAETLRAGAKAAKSGYGALKDLFTFHRKKDRKKVAKIKAKLIHLGPADQTNRPGGYYDE